jgi:general secretion pathway protein E
VAEGAPFEFKSKSQLVEFLKQRGYEVVENATMKGRSGAEHNIDILATRDDGIVIHHIAVGVEVGQDKIGLDKVFDFDDKTYDIGIRDKVFIAVPGLTREARQFAERQRIKVFEAKEL